MPTLWNLEQANEERELEITTTNSCGACKGHPDSLWIIKWHEVKIKYIQDRRRWLA